MKTASVSLPKIGLVVLVLIVAAWTYTYYFVFEVEEREVLHGYTKEAKRHPHLAAKLFLADRLLESEHVKSYRLIDRIDVNDPDGLALDDTLILLNTHGTLSGERFQRLRAWVEAGGTLLLSLENPYEGESRRDDLSDYLDISVNRVDYDDSEDEEGAEESDEEHEGVEETVEEDAEAPATDAAKATKYSDQDACFLKRFTTVSVSGSEESSAFSFDRGYYFSLGEVTPEWVLTETYLDGEDYNTAALFNLERGSIYVLASTWIWRNQTIQCRDNAFLLWNMINQNGKVWFLENRDAPSLFALLLRHLRAGVVGLGLLLALFLWLAYVRFGPRFSSQDLSRRKFAEHIKADAQFVWRHRGFAVALKALRNGVAARIKRSVHDYDAKTEYEKVMSIKALSGIDEQLVHTALFKSDIESANEFIQCVKILKQLKGDL